MTQLRKQHLTYYYAREEQKGAFGGVKTKEVKRDFVNRKAFMLMKASDPSMATLFWPYAPNGCFPVIRHDVRGFLPRKGKKRNMTHARQKRRNRRKAA